MTCKICDKPTVDGKEFCVMHLARWLQYGYLMTYRHSTLDEVRAWFIKWQKGDSK